MKVKSTICLFHANTGRDYFKHGVEEEEEKSMEMKNVRQRRKRRRKRK